MKRTKSHLGDARITLEPLEPRLLLAGTAYVVNSLADTVAADGGLTLREALLAANTNWRAVNEAPAGSNIYTDTITFADSLFASGPAKITLSGTQLAINDDLLINGPGSNLLTIDAAGLSRVFEIWGSDTRAELDGVNITGGSTTGLGGGIYVTGDGTGGTVTLKNSTISGNSASSNGGGISVDGGTLTLTNSTVSGNSVTGDASGGGIFVWNGILTLTDSMVSGNSAVGGGGLYFIGINKHNELTLANSTVSGNSATRSGGGGIYICAGGTVTLTNSTVSENLATADSFGAYGYGGGMRINSGTVSLTDSAISENAANSGGGIYIDSGIVTITNSTVSGNSANSNADHTLFPASYGGGIYIANGTLTLTNSTVSGNSVIGSSSAFSSSVGGGIYVADGTVMLTNSSVSENSVTAASGARGGGICVDEGTVTLTDSTVSENFAATSAPSSNSSGGGIYDYGNVTLTNSTVSKNSATVSHGFSFGGGIYVGGIMTLTDSTVSENSAAGLDSIASSFGGGIYTAGGTVTLTNSAVSGNSTTAPPDSYSYGGGIDAELGALALINCTVCGNSATNPNRSFAQGGGVYVDDGSMMLNNTIVAINWSDGRKDNIHGSWSGCGNLVGGSPGFVRDPSLGTDGIWGTADDNPGDLHLQGWSRCIDRGINSLAKDSNGNRLTTDLGGNARKVGSAVDIGAYEFDTLEFILTGGHRAMDFLDADGTCVQVVYKGPGSATIVRSPNPDSPSGKAWGDILSVTIDGSGKTSKLDIRTGAHNRTNVGQIVVHGTIKSILAGTTRLAGDLTVDGSIADLNMGNASSGTISIGAPAVEESGAVAKIILGRARDVSLVSQTPIRSLEAVEWLDTDDQTDVISAPWIDSLTITGAPHAPTSAGDFAANLTLTDANRNGFSLRRFNVHGAVTGGWTLAGAAGSILMGNSLATWTALFGTHGDWADVGGITTTSGDLSGQITARSIGRIKVKGKTTNATITLNPI